MFSEAPLKDELVGLDFVEVIPSIANEMIVPDTIDYDAPFEPEFEPLYEPQFEPEMLAAEDVLTKPQRTVADSSKSSIKKKIAKANAEKRTIAKKKKVYRKRRVLAASGERKLKLRNLHTGEKIKATYWENGKYISETMRDVAHLLRDHRTGDKHRIDAGLMDILFDLQLRIGSKKEFHVISGYRSPKTNRMLSGRSKGVAKKSLHMRGRAIDIRLPGTELRNLRKAALSMKAGGVGYYPQANFLHVDTGRFRTWG
jgi:uncharacterized protein YcbK (DUF882 family)